MAFVVAPSRKPAFWAEVEKAARAEKRASNAKEKPEVAAPAAKKPAPVKNAKPPAKSAAKGKAKR
jgi:hypothetical protein